MPINSITGKCFWIGDKWDYLIYITNDKNFLLWHRNKNINQEKLYRLINFLSGKKEA